MMNPILLIVGPPASGKSTVSREIAKRSAKGLHIPVDDLRAMVQGGVIHPGLVWPDELEEQLTLARQTAVDMALRYQKAGFLVAIDDFWDPYSKLIEYQPLFSNSTLIKIILKPAVGTTVARNHARQSPSAYRDHMDDAIKTIIDDIDLQLSELKAQGWHIYDTSNDTIEESVYRIRTFVESAIKTHKRGDQSSNSSQK